MSASVMIRPARPDAADYVVRAHRLPHAVGFVHGPTSVERFAAALEEKTRLIMSVETDDGPVGTLMAIVTEPPWLVEFGAIVISEPGRGYGRIAVGWLVDYAFGVLHAHWISLNVIARNTRAPRLYESVGFVDEGTWRDGFRDDDGIFHDLCIYGMLEKDRL